MAPVNEKTVHFTHPNHTLTATVSAKKFMCDGCKEIGTGTRFNCGSCDFDLHYYCAKAPPTLSSYMDPHKLARIVYTGGKRGICDVCNTATEGMAYFCHTCDFVVHPGCTHYPEYIDLAVDPKHYLVLQQFAPQECNVCGEKCVYMRYSCRLCNVDVHPRCIDGWKLRPVKN